MTVISVSKILVRVEKYTYGIYCLFGTLEIVCRIWTIYIVWWHLCELFIGWDLGRLGCSSLLNNFTSCQCLWKMDRLICPYPVTILSCYLLVFILNFWFFLGFICFLFWWDSTQPPLVEKSLTQSNS